MQDRPLEIGGLVRCAERMFAHKSVITGTVDGETIATWGDVIARARRLGAALDMLEVSAGARVATFAWNTQRHLELYLGIPSTGRVLHTVNHRLFAADLAHILSDAVDDVVFVDRSLIATVWDVVAEASSVRWVVVMDDGAPDPLPDDPRVLDYEELLGRPPEGQESMHAVADENKAASLCYTSDTTGKPKGVLYSHRSIVLHALLLLGADTFGICERDVVMPIVPMFHVNAWGLPYAALMSGSTLGLPGPTAPLVDVRVVDDDGQPVPYDGSTSGELQVAGPTIASGYLGAESEADSFTADGWLRTGDVATLDEHGYVRIVDRTKDVIKSSGEWISSVSLENGLMDHPLVQEAAVIGVQDERWGERPFACVVPVPDANLDETELRRHLASRVASWWIPDGFTFLDQIPKTATGKFSKAALRARARAAGTTQRAL